MKKVVLFLFVIFISNSYAAPMAECLKPAGIYTDVEMVLNQFVFNNGNPNWGDWCFEIEPSETPICNNELDLWDKWLSCSEIKYKEHCHEYAVKENFLVSLEGSEYDAFIKKCVLDNYKSLL